MSAAIGLWSKTIQPGEPVEIELLADLRITNVALGDDIVDEKGRTTVKIIYRPPGSEEDSDDEDEDDEDDEEARAEKANAFEIETAILCSLTYGKIEQTTIDVVLPAEREYLVQVVGKNPVHLVGNYIDQRPLDEAPYSDDEESDEDAYDLRDVSSDVEVYPDELDLPSEEEGRFEEVAEDEPPKESSKKRPRESDATDSGKLSKAEKKKQKKLKGENGEAVQAPTPVKEETGKKDKKEKKEKGDKEKKTKAETKTLQGGVQAADHKVGTGPKAKAGDMVSVRYIGKLQNGKVFDQNKTGKPFTFRLGKGEVIKGWDIGVAGMQPGGERLLTIPAPMAYGKKSQSGIPANSTLIFEVKLVEIK